MVYYTCPHCEASLAVAVKWDVITCPFCKGQIVFSETAFIDEEHFYYWRKMNQRGGKSNKVSQ